MYLLEHCAFLAFFPTGRNSNCTALVISWLPCLFSAAPVFSRIILMSCPARSLKGTGALLLVAHSFQKLTQFSLHSACLSLLSFLFLLLPALDISSSQSLPRSLGDLLNTSLKLRSAGFISPFLPAIHMSTRSAFTLLLLILLVSEFVSHRFFSLGRFLSLPPHNNICIPAYALFHSGSINFFFSCYVFIFWDITLNLLNNCIDQGISMSL